MTAQCKPKCVINEQKSMLCKFATMLCNFAVTTLSVDKWSYDRVLVALDALVEEGGLSRRPFLSNPPYGRISTCDSSQLSETHEASLVDSKTSSQNFDSFEFELEGSVSPNVNNARRGKFSETQSQQAEGTQISFIGAASFSNSVPSMKTAHCRHDQSARGPGPPSCRRLGSLAAGSFFPKLFS